MVLPVSGFLPVPLPMMIPFMGAQSLVIGKMFGEGFQYGKRKISAMPNEEFNKYTFQDMMQNARSEIASAIPTMEASMHDMQTMVETVIQEFTDYLSKVIERAPEALAQIGASQAAAGFGGPVGLGLDAVVNYLKSQNRGDLATIAATSMLGYGRTGSGAGAPPPVRVSSVQGLTVSQAQEAARLRQLQYEKARAEARRQSVPGRIALSKTIQPVPQIRAGGITKRPAGQSQRMARREFISKIAMDTKRLKLGALRSADRADIVRRIRLHQQLLVNLLARYRF